MKILHVNSSDSYGGAAKAVISLHKSLMKENIESFILTRGLGPKLENDLSKNSSIKNVINILKNGIARKICRLYKIDKKETLSISIFNSNIVNEINKIDCDIVNLHWICDEFISIEQIKKIKKPIVWSLYDMWPFSGAEHYSNDHRFQEGYLKNNRNKNESGIDINRWVWNRKRKILDFPLQLIAPSQWLKSITQKSFIFKNFKIDKIGHPIDVNFWKNISKIYSKEIFNIDKEKKLLVFFSSGSTQNHRKGLDYLFQIVKNLKVSEDQYDLIIVGQKKKKNFMNKKNIKYIDFLKDDISRKILYNAADLVLAPSRTEAFGLVVAESAACGTSSVGFENTGVSETILHKETGYLAKENNIDDFTSGIEWFFEDHERFFNLGMKAKKYVSDNFSDNLIAKKYIGVYKKIIEK